MAAEIDNTRGSLWREAGFGLFLCFIGVLFVWLDLSGKTTGLFLSQVGSILIGAGTAVISTAFWNVKIIKIHEALYNQTHELFYGIIPILKFEHSTIEKEISSTLHEYIHSYWRTMRKDREPTWMYRKLKWTRHGKLPVLTTVSRIPDPDKAPQSYDLVLVQLHGAVLMLTHHQDSSENTGVWAFSDNVRNKIMIGFGRHTAWSNSQSLSLGILSRINLLDRNIREAEFLEGEDVKKVEQRWLEEAKDIHDNLLPSWRGSGIYPAD